MRILMLETRRGTEDGFSVRQFVRGREYEIADSLARAFLAAGWAVLPNRRSPQHSSFK